jgi:hypothetical protein
MNVIDRVQVWPGLIGKIFLTTGVLQLGLLQILLGTASVAAISTVALGRGHKPGIMLDGNRRIGYDAEFTVQQD